MVEFKLNKDGLEQLKAAAVAKIQPELDAKVQDAIRSVRDSYDGESVEVVHARLVAALKSDNFEPNEDNLLVIAREIVAGTLEG